MSKKNIIRIAILISLYALIFEGYIYYKQHAVDYIRVKNFDNINGSFSIGKQTAKNTLEIIESPTCIHCQAWNKNILPEIKKKYVDTGKLKIIFHDIPMDNAGVFAVSLINCVPKEQKEIVHEKLLSSFQDWAMQPSEIEIQNNIIKNSGLTDNINKIKECMLSQDTKEKIGNERSQLLTLYNLKATPTFITIPYVYTGYTDENSKKIQKYLDK